MKIVYNLKNFEPVPEGERILEITEAKCTPSGKPQQLDVTFKDVETGKTLKSNYKFNVPGAVIAMGFLCKVVLKMEDAGEFDTQVDTPRLVGKKVLALVKHVEGTTPKEDGTFPIFANIDKIIDGVGSTETTTTTTTQTNITPRQAIADNDLD